MLLAWDKNLIDIVKEVFFTVIATLDKSTHEYVMHRVFKKLLKLNLNIKPKTAERKVDNFKKLLLYA